MSLCDEHYAEVLGSRGLGMSPLESLFGGSGGMRAIVELQLRRVAQTAAAQQVEIDFHKSLVNHLAQAGYDAEFGARILKRQVRFDVEAKLANAMLRGDVNPGDRLMMSYDPAGKETRIETQEQKAAAEKPAMQKPLSWPSKDMHSRVT